MLKEKGIENARLDAELLLADVLGIDRLKLYLQHDRPVTPEELVRFREHVRRRMKREPVQYIIGRVPFRRLELKVDRRALIPRPETEVLVGEVLKWLAAREIAEPRVLDIGTGTGAIALSLASEGGCRVTATDLSPEALSLATENTQALGLGDRVELRQGETWSPVQPDERFDVIVSNPPYVDEADRSALAPEVAAFEPAAALFAQQAGLAVLCDIIGRAHEHLVPGGLLAMEIGATQGPAVTAVIAEAGRYAPARIVRDLAGRERIAMTELNSGE